MLSFISCLHKANDLMQRHLWFLYIIPKYQSIFAYRLQMVNANHVLAPPQHVVEVSPKTIAHYDYFRTVLLAVENAASLQSCVTCKQDKK